MDKSFYRQHSELEWKIMVKFKAESRKSYKEIEKPANLESFNIGKLALWAPKVSLYYNLE